MLSDEVNFLCSLFCVDRRAKGVLCCFHVADISLAFEVPCVEGWGPFFMLFVLC